jgi:hypothetical protein
MWNSIPVTVSVVESSAGSCMVISLTLPAAVTSNAPETLKSLGKRTCDTLPFNVSVRPDTLTRFPNDKASDPGRE